MLPVNPYNDGNDVFIVKIDTSGGKIWHTFIGGTSFDSGSDIALDNDKNIYITGSTTSGWVDNRSGIPIMILDNKGETVWYTAIAEYAGRSANAIAVAANGDFFITGKSPST